MPHAGLAMITLTTLTWHASLAGRWIGRVAGLLCVLFVLAFIVGEGPPAIWRMNSREALFALDLTALFGGLILAWFWEGWGGLMSVCAWGALAAVERQHAFDPPFLVPCAVGLLHILCWWRLRGPAPPPLALTGYAKVLSERVWVAFWVLVTLLVLLSANEMFGQPPLMTGCGAPPTEVVGTWSATLTTVSGRPLPNPIPIEIKIAPGGSVTGLVGGADLTGGELVRNRSWFGQLVNWRTDYAIRGWLSREVQGVVGSTGGPISALLDSSGDRLHGTISLPQSGPPRSLRVELRQTRAAAPIR